MKTMTVIGIVLNALRAEVHMRANDIESHVGVRIGKVTIERLDSGDAPAAQTRVKVQYEHVVTAETASGEKIYDALAKVALFLELGPNEAAPTKDDAFAFLDSAIAFALPFSASKLRELFFSLGVSDPPLIPLSPRRMEDAGGNTVASSLDHGNPEEEESNNDR